MTREADGVIYTHAGPEIGVAFHQGVHLPVGRSFFCSHIYLGQIRKPSIRDPEKNSGRP
jgi:glucosamine--fructose-6-phosphate aminotransferase (isomerizing)